MESKYPETLIVEVTAKHLSVPKHVNPLIEAVKDTLKREGIDLHAWVSLDTVRIMNTDRTHHVARYGIPNDLWRVVVRHQMGRRVAPGTFELEAIWREALAPVR